VQRSLPPTPPGIRATVRHGTLMLAAGALAVSALVAGTAGVSAATTHPVGAPGYSPPPIGHVWTIILENKSYESTFTGLNQNDYLWKTLPSYGLLLRQYYGTGHYSLDNYISAVSGQSPAPANQSDCPRYENVEPGLPASDGQTYASTGCVYPASVPTLFNQLQENGVSWKVYAQDMGNKPKRERVYHCGIPGSPDGAGVPDPGGALPHDQYVPKHNPAPWFHSLIDSRAMCHHVVPLEGYPATPGHAAIPSIEQDLSSVATTPQFSWISPNNCSDAHDATCRGPNLSGNPDDHQGGLYAADLFLEKYIPMIMASPAFQQDGMIQIIFDEAFPPYKMYGNSTADYEYGGDDALGQDTATGQSVQAEANTAQSVVACCNELPGPNTTQPGDQAFDQDTTPGGGITGAVFISRYITPGSITDQPYNRYSWLRSIEDLVHITTGGTDGAGHLGYAAADGLRPFGPDVYNNATGMALEPSPSGSEIFPATATITERPVPRVNVTPVPVP
jgi:phosphatidylinositol-3-phosphatase